MRRTQLAEDLDALLGIDDDELVGDEAIGDEAIGVYETIGDEAIGAMVRKLAAAGGGGRGGRGGRGAGYQQALQAAIIQKQLANKVLVGDRPYNKQRRKSIPLDSNPFNGNLPVAFGAQVTITVRPQYLFKGGRFVVNGSIAAFFLLDDIKVGVQSQKAGNGSEGCEVYAQNAFGVGLALDDCQMAQDIVVQVTNIDATGGGTPHRFLGSIIGKAVVAQ